ncbi:MAG: precorrin-6y C5,15-methyltransferase (decarboxylating) subunit CbiE [Alphaproteobacteria bacterium]
MTRWLSIVGIGEDGLDGITSVARALVDQAEVLVGSARHLAMIADDHPAERLPWAAPMAAGAAAVVARRGQRVCVLATGDPLWFGIGARLAGLVPHDERTILPAPSAFSLAAARMGWPLGDVETVTIHGRSLDLLRLHVAPGARLLAMTSDGETPAQVARILCEMGYGESPITVLEHMGGTAENRVEGSAEGWPKEAMADLNTLAIECRAGPEAIIRSRSPGLPDNAFENDGQLTKREVRAVTLAALGPLPGQRLWDVGAGCGSVAIEWLRAAKGVTAVAIERDPDRAAMIARNATALGTPGLEIVTGDAPAALTDLDGPDAVFIGGGVSVEGLIGACWDALRPGGRLIANAVTVEGEAALSAWHEKVGGTLTRIAISRTKPLGTMSGWHSLAPVTQWAVTK